MKRVFSLLLLIFVTIFVLSGCTIPGGGTTPGGSGNTPGGNDTPGGNETPGGDIEDNPDVEPVGFYIHYMRTDNNYTPWKLWLWDDGRDGAVYEFNGKDSYGAYYKAEFDGTVWSETTLNGKLGFIIAKLTVDADGKVQWGSKDYESDRSIVFKNFKKDAEGYYHIYLRQSKGEIFTNAAGEFADVVNKFEIQRENGKYFLWFDTNKEYSDFTITCNGEEVVSHKTVKFDPNVYNHSTMRFKYYLGTEMPDVKVDYKLEVKFKKSDLVQVHHVDKASLYKTSAFTQLYTYEGELGAIYTPEHTTFRVWSPISSSMKVRVYETGTPAKYNIGGVNVVFEEGSDKYTEYEMYSIENGAWEYVLHGDQEGKYYTYVVTNASYENREVVDPYAKSTGINGLRGMIVDFSKVNPEGWDDISILEIPSSQLTVYETHVADMTSDDTWGGTAENAKIFKGLYETGTTYTSGNTTVTTGFDHIKELGVNAVQLIPIYDQANDERPDNDPTRTDGSVRQFNWGYNPLNYNSLDGIYSSNPYDGYVRIQEFKELVMAYNKAGITIIMDVVYNHTAGLSGNSFDVLMPKYYYRYVSGEPSNGSGCGNETASEMPMFRKFMKDSTEFWATEYKLGGFRFDLMGIHDVTTMNELSANLHENVSEYITIYGEPWTGGTIGLAGTAANQNNIDKYQGFGQFNDKVRDALIKGGMAGATDKGWVNGNTSVMTDLINGIKGITLSKETDPTKSVQYVTCHDNYTLYDRLKVAGESNNDIIKKQAMLANSVVFTSQGITFMLAGEEMLRTKGGDFNSYNSGYEVNTIDYSLKVKHLDMFENYKKLISLKQNVNLFGKDAAAISSDVVVTSKANNTLVVVEIVDNVNKVKYIICHSNGVSGAKTVDLSGYTLYLDTLNINGFQLSSSTQIQNYQTIVAYKSIA